MTDLTQDATFSSEGLQDFQFSFKTDCISRIEMHYAPDILSKEWKWDASVTFKKGNTQGKQNFEHTDFKTIVKQIEDFLTNLEE